MGSKHVFRGSMMSLMALVAFALAPALPCAPDERAAFDQFNEDGDGAWDGDERHAQTDPADPDSKP